jgi:hypothetical protein
MTDLLETADLIRAKINEDDLVPRRLTGTLWFIFTSILTEAEHAHKHSPEPILDAAWNYEERLRKSFGPKFDMSLSCIFAGRPVTMRGGDFGSGVLTLKDMPVSMIMRDGKRLIPNTRSAQTLIQTESVGVVLGHRSYG